MAAAAHVGDFEHRAPTQFALDPEGEFVHLRYHAVAVDEVDRLPQESAQTERAAGGHQDACGIGIRKAVAAQEDSAALGGDVRRGGAESLVVSRREGGQVAETDRKSTRLN